MGSSRHATPPRIVGRVRVEEPGRSPLVVVLGSAGPGLTRVHRVLVSAGVPVVFGEVRTEAARTQLIADHWARWQRGPVLAVLVDPVPVDWSVPTALGARTVVVLSADPDPTSLADLLLRGACAVVRGAEVDQDLAPVLSLVVRGYVAMDAARMADLTDAAVVQVPSHQ
ncbi:MAG TPA: hypothetical protein VIL37_03335 [Natronosporangium sp.]